MKSKSLNNQISSNDEEEDQLNDGTTTKQKSLSTNNVYSDQMKNQFQSFSIKFGWKKQFSNFISESILNTNFESMSLSLHYGNYSLLCNIIFMKFPPHFFSSLKELGKGSFGSVYEVEIDKSHYAIKVIDVKGGISKGLSKQIYREYFLTCLADQLGVGPKVTQIFGYDLLVIQNSVIFSMQKCSPSKKNKNANIERQLLQSLQIMHSVGFIHADIKPENIAFSEKRQKHVFFDYGLSSLRAQKKGQKSFVTFVGTLKYCSEEMKKCYILRQKMFVDLFENDHFCLKKTFFDFKTSNQILPSRQTFRQQKNSGIQQKDPHSLLINRLCDILNLKYEIFHNNARGILWFLSKCSDLPNSYREILENIKANKQIMADQRIRDFLKKDQDKRCNSQKIQNKIDKKISLYINVQAISDILQNSIPIGVIIKMQKQKFISLLGIPYWLIKIFVFLDPFQDQKVQQFDKNKWIDRKNIIQKIFQTFASKQKIELSNKFPDFISVKTQFTLRFIYDRMKNTKILKSVKILHSFWLLLLATMAKFDYVLIQEIEHEILLLIEDKDQLLLRIINFLLFWIYHNCGFDFTNEILSQWIEKVRSQTSNQQSIFSKKLLNLLNLIDSNLKQQIQMSTIKLRQIIDQLLDKNENKKYTQLIYNTELLLFHTINKINFQIIQQTNLSKLQFDIIISHQFSFIRPSSCCSKIKVEFLSLFIRFTCQSIYKNPLGYNNNQFLANQFENYQFEYFTYFYEIIGINDILISSFIRSIQKNTQNLLIYSKIIIKQSYINVHNYYKMFLSLCNISQVLVNVQANIRQDNPITRLSKLQIQKLFDKIHILVNFLESKCMGSKKKYLFYFKFQSINIKLALNNKQKRIILIKQLVQNLLPFNFTHKLTSFVILGIFSNFRYQILQKDNSNNEACYLCDTFQKLFDYIHTNLSLYLSEASILHNCRQLFGIYLKVKLFKNKIEQGFNLLLKYLKIFHKTHVSKQKNYIFVIQYAHLHFVQKIDLEFKFQKYYQLINNKHLQINFNFLIFNLYIEIKNKLEKSERIAFLFRCSLAIGMMKPYYSFILRFYILRDAHQLELWNNNKKRRLLMKRKQLYCLLLNNYIQINAIKLNYQKINKINDENVKSYLFAKQNKYYLNCTQI